MIFKALDLLNYLIETRGLFLGKEGQGTLKAHMVRGTAGTFVLKVVNTILALGTSLLLAQLLGAKEYGVYAYAISWASLLAVPAVMGLNTLLVREVARYKALENWGCLRGIICWSDRVVLAASSGLAALFAMLVWVLQGKFTPEVRTGLWISMALVPLLSLLLLRQGGLQGLGYVVEAQVPQLLVLPGVFVILVSGFYFTAGLSGTTAIELRVLAGLIAVFVALFLLRKCTAKSVADVSHIYNQRKWLNTALPLLFVGVAGIINQRISIVVVGAMLGAKAAGIFDVALKGATLVSFTLLAVNVPLASAVAELYAKGEIERLQRLVTKSARVAFLASLPVGLGMIIFGRWVLSIFGSDFTAGSVALAILSGGQLVNVAMGSVALLLNMTGHERDTAKGVGIAALVNVAVNAALIPVWGVEGAAAAYALSMTIWNILLATWVRKKLKVHSTALGDFCSERVL